VAALGVPAHAPARRSLKARAALALALTTACGVSERADLVGRYEATTGAAHEEWRLAADGTCQITRAAGAAAPVTTRCEWEWVDRDGRRRLVVTLLPEDGAPLRHRTRYVLTPTRAPGGRVTIPLGAGGDLRQVP
jgi:hypothetical protein